MPMAADGSLGSHETPYFELGPHWLELEVTTRAIPRGRPENA